MTLRGIFRSLLSRVKPKTDDRNMVSIVLLLREPDILLEGEYAAAIEKSWGASEQNRAVVQGPLAILRVDTNLIHAVCGGRPYWTSKRNLPAWADHEAFMTVDHMSPKSDTKARYAVIARLVLALLTENCVAAFSPGVGGLVRNDESLMERLRATASSCKTGA
jgi:hypothetical protein